MKPTAENLGRQLRRWKNPDQAAVLARYFKTGPGQYGQGDVFLGLNVGRQRQVAQNFTDLPYPDLQKILNSPWHEFRFTALIILVNKYNSLKARAADQEIDRLIGFYLKNIKNINNWDLVDASCYHLLGSYLFERKRDILYRLATDWNIWARRIAIVSTFYFIKKNDLDDTYNLSFKLFGDQKDLIHKAVGWMLREAGNRDQARLEAFLKKHVKIIPRTTWRYAIEKFPEKHRRELLKLT